MLRGGYGDLKAALRRGLLALLAINSSVCARVPVSAPTTSIATPTERARAASSTHRPVGADDPEDSVARQHTRLILPFEGTWIVGQGYHGGESHHGHAAFALDLVKLDAHDRAYARRGKRRGDWVGFGAELRATAAGVVVRAIDHHPDNRVLGKGTRSNTVIIQHRATEFSEYVHLQRGSLRVAVGDEVVPEQVLARCGNSGSQTPHLHWALLSSPDPIRTRAAVFADYEVRDERGVWQAADGTPRSGQVIRNVRDRH